MRSNWASNCYSRLLIDNHIADTAPHFMSKFSPETYVKMVEESGCESAMVYACDHNGNCYYPTRCGHVHRGIHGRDIFGEIVQLLQRKGIPVTAYYTVLYHNESVAKFPKAAQVDILGHDFNRRYRVACPNAPETTGYYLEQLAEILQYPIQGIFIDMSFWAMFCCCENCARLYKSRYNRELPATIDWRDTNWRTYIQFRQETVAEFAQNITDFIRQKRPDITVTHQFSGIHGILDRGQTGLFRKSSDYASGDFYGDRRMQRLGVKIFDAYTTAKPFEYMTSFCVNLNDHTSTKNDEEMLLHALTTLAHGGAYLFIDAINPDGTLEEARYRRLKQMNKTLAPFRETIKTLAPLLQGKVAIYYSPALFAWTALNGTPMEKFAAQRIMSSKTAVPLQETTGVAALLARMKVPCRFLTECSPDWSEYQVVIIADAASLTEAECQSARRFVDSGGTLIVTGRTSLVEKDFALADVMGVHYLQQDSPPVCYLKDKENIVFSGKPTPYVIPGTETTVRAGLAVSFYPPGDRDNYASIHSDPPEVDTGHPAWTEHPYGKGLCVYLATNLFGVDQDSHQKFGIHFLSQYLPCPVQCSIANEAVEVTVLKGKNRELLICAVNDQTEYPILPIHDFELNVTLPPDFRPSQVLEVTTGKKEQPVFSRDGSCISIHCDKLHYGEMWIVSGNYDGEQR